MIILMAVFHGNFTNSGADKVVKLKITCIELYL